MSKEKIGILVEGGGMKCAFSAGVLDVFLDENIMPDYVIGVSAGAANSASYVAKQRDRNRRFYCEHSQAPQYINLKQWSKTGDLFDLNYIYGTLSNSDGEDPLDYEAIMENPCEFVITATCVDGSVKYFTKEDLHKDDFSPIMASSALPTLANPVEIEGKLYFDGGVGDSLPIEKMIADGCTKFIVLFSKRRDYKMTKQKYKRFYHAYLKGFKPIKWRLDGRHINYNHSKEIIDRLEREGKAFTFAPSPFIKMKTTTTDPAVMQELYDNGVASARARMHQLKEFIGNEQ